MSVCYTFKLLVTDVCVLYFGTLLVTKVSHKEDISFNITGGLLVGKRLFLVLASCDRNW